MLSSQATIFSLLEMNKCFVPWQPNSLIQAKDPVSRSLLLEFICYICVCNVNLLHLFFCYPAFSGIYFSCFGLRFPNQNKISLITWIHWEPLAPKIVALIIELQCLFTMISQNKLKVRGSGRWVGGRQTRNFLQTIVREGNYSQRFPSNRCNQNYKKCPSLICKCKWKRKQFRM